MEFSPLSVMVDDTFSNPLIWVSMVVAATALTLPASVLVWLARSLGRSLTGLTVVPPLAVVCLWVSPGLLESVAEAIANLGTEKHVSLCLLPTNLLPRDYAPGLLAIAVSTVVWWRVTSGPASGATARMSARRVGVSGWILLVGWSIVGAASLVGALANARLLGPLDPGSLLPAAFAILCEVNVAAQLRRWQTADAIALVSAGLLGLLCVLAIFFFDFQLWSRVVVAGSGLVLAVWSTVEAVFAEEG